MSADQIFHGGGASVVEVHDQVAGRLVVQAAVGWAVAPSTRIRRVACSMTAEFVPRGSERHPCWQIPDSGLPRLPGWYAALARERQQETAGQSDGVAVRVL